VKKAKELVQVVPNPNLNTRGVLSDWIFKAEEVLWEIINNSSEEKTTQGETKKR